VRSIGAVFAYETKEVFADTVVKLGGAPYPLPMPERAPQVDRFFLNVKEASTPRTPAPPTEAAPEG
jgi:hypothetical protein